MTVTLNLRPEIQADLLTQATASGMILEDYLLTIVEEAAHSTNGLNAEDLERRTEAVRRMLEFGDSHHLSLAEPVTRAGLHENHRF